MVLQLAVLPEPPLLDGPVPVLQHRLADFDDAPQSAVTTDRGKVHIAIRTN